MDETLTLDDAPPRAPAGGPALCRVFQCDAPAAPPRWLWLDDMAQLEIGRGDEEVTTASSWTIVDGRASRPHAKLTRIGAQWMLEDLGSKNGVVVDGEAVRQTRVPDGALLEVGRTFFVFRAQVPRAVSSLPQTFEAPPLSPLTTASPALAATLQMLQRVSSSVTPVLLAGETGTGKEVFARRVHALSRRKGQLIAVNCGALPSELVEAELFGAKRGAYSGAQTDRDGLVRAADGGTLFLDEIGDLPLPSQAALLRVLQEKEVLPVGATKPVPVDFRLVSATHRNLDGMVAAGTFRADLRARLAGATVALPPLRERREDMALLFASFLRGEERPVTLTVPAARALLRARFAGNVRALERAVEAALARADDGGAALRLDVEHFPDLEAAAPKQRDEDDVSLDDDLSKRLHTLLEEHKGNVSAVARVMGKKRMQVYRWIERYGLTPERYR